MRAANYSSMNIFNESQIKEINRAIRSNFVEGKDDFAVDSHKTSDVKFVFLGKIQKFIFPFIDFSDETGKTPLQFFSWITTLFPS